MSDNNRNINSSIGKYLDYLRDLLGGRERNALERNLEKDPFEKDALEGFQSIGADDLESDIKDLNKNLYRRVNKSNRVLIYRVAAGIAIIISLSVSYLLVFDKQIDQFPENLQVSEHLEEDKATEFSDEVSNQMDSGYLEDEMGETEIIANKTEPDIEKTQGLDSKEELADMDIVTLEENIAVIEDKNLTEVTLVFADEDEAAIVREEIETLAFQAPMEEVSVEKQEAAPEAVAEIFDRESAVQKSASRAKKTTASPSVSQEESGATKGEVSSPVISNSMQPITLEEVVILKPGDEKGVVDFTPANPEAGMRKFRKYIEENIGIQGSVPEKNRAVVVLKFIVNEKGKTEQFRIIESPDTSFSKEAIRLVEEGPIWIPAKRSGNYSAEEISLRIVFKN